MLLLFFAWLCGFYYWSFHVESCLALYFRVVSVLFSIVITSLGEERAGFSCYCLHALNFGLFSLPLCVTGWLRLVLVALPGNFYLCFCPGYDFRHICNCYGIDFGRFLYYFGS